MDRKDMCYSVSVAQSIASIKFIFHTSRFLLRLRPLLVLGCGSSSSQDRKSFNRFSPARILLWRCASITVSFDGPKSGPMNWLSLDHMLLIFFYSVILSSRFLR